MKCRFRKFIFVFLSLIYILYVPLSYSNIVVVHADSIGGNVNGQRLWKYLTEKGCSKWWAATAIGNSFAEHGLSTSIDEKANYWGAFQISRGSLDDFKSWSREKGYSQDDIIGQYEYFIQKYRGGCCKDICGIDIATIEKDTEYIKDARSAAAYFAAGMEGCVCWKGVTKGKGKFNDSHNHDEKSCTSFDFSPSGSKYGIIQLQHLERRVNNTQVTYEAFINYSGNGTTTTSHTGTSTTTDNTQSEGTQSEGTSEDGTQSEGTTQSSEIVPVNGCAYSESELTAMLELSETTLDSATSDSLSIDQNYTLQNWQQNIDSELEETILVVWMRRIVTILGIMFTVWMLFLYMSYWFDRVNVFFEFSLLSILSLGKLRISPDEYECTWQLSELVRSKSGGTMTVNHRAMLEIVIIGCLFGSLIISGMMFKIVRIAILWILKIIGVIS